jgi:uncharacterized membrane protein
MTLLILAAALVTYLTRVMGYVILTRFKSIPPRVEAGLEAVPAAVLTSIVAPAIITGGWEAAVAVLVAFVAGWRVTGIKLILIGWAVAMLLRHLI